jgi:hypothetical protein
MNIDVEYSWIKDIKNEPDIILAHEIHHIGQLSI